MAEAVVNYDDCEWIVVGTVCVGDVNNGNAPDICKNLWELICPDIGPIIPENPYFPPIDPNEGGPGSPGPPSSSQNDGCEGITKATHVTSLSNVASTISNIVSSPIEIGHHLYATNPTTLNPIHVGPARPGTVNSWPPFYTWNQHNGYAIGSIHNHPNNSAPSPSDAMAGIYISQMRADNHPSAEVDFVTKHNTTIVVTSSYIYTITIKDAALFEAFQASHKTDEITPIDVYLEYVAEFLLNFPNNLDATKPAEYALLMMYGDAINLTRQDINSTPNPTLLQVDNQGEVTYTGC